MSSEGLFIVLEGVDGSGKTTLARGLAERLASEGADVRLTAEPTDGRIGTLLREGITDDPRAEALLFAADRACHTAEIGRLLEEGVAVALSVLGFCLLGALPASMMLKPSSAAILR